MKTKVKLLDEKAEIPVKALPGDTGYDIKMIGVEKIEGDVIFFKTGVSLQPPGGYYFDIVPRSSISKLPLEMANSIAVIDASYSGEILIPIRITHSAMGQNKKNETFPSGIVDMFGSKPQNMSMVANLVLQKKPYLCQLILRKRFSTDFELVDTLNETERGAGGFGSTDK